MKTLSLLRIGLAVIATAFLVQCSSTPKTRIEKNPQMYGKLSARDQHFVTHGLIHEGMTRDGVFLAWGRPDTVSVGVNRGRESENWTYEGQRPIRSMNMGMGMGFGGYGGFGGFGGYGGFGPYGYGGWGPYGYGGYPFGGTSVTYIPYTSGVAEFVNGRVVSWKSTKR
jgi:hypothetical protein